MTESMDARRSGAKSEAAFRTISEVASDLDVPQHVLRFWETKFSQIRPMKRGGGRRYYRPEDVVLLRRIRALLYDDGLTIKGVQKLFREKGVKALMADEQPLPATLEKVEAIAGARLHAAAAAAQDSAPQSATAESNLVPGCPTATAPDAGTAQEGAANGPETALASGAGR